MTNLLSAVALGITTGSLLIGFYRTVRDRWPNLYVYERSNLEKAVQRTFVRYILFRTLPPYVAFAATATTASRLELDETLTTLMAAAVFILATAIRTTIRSFRLRSRRAATATIQLGSAFWVLICALAALGSYHHISGLIPTPQAFVDAAWTALFITVAAFSFQKLLATSHNSPEQRIALTVSDVSPGTWGAAARIASENHVPPILMRAIVAAEAAQRPRWVRQCERILVRTLLGKVAISQGVTQERSRLVISDEESLQQTALFLAQSLSDADTVKLSSWSSTSDWEESDDCRQICRSIAMRRNHDPRYGQEVAEFAETLAMRRNA